MGGESSGEVLKNADIQRAEGSRGAKKEIEVDIKKIRGELAEISEAKGKANVTGWGGQGNSVKWYREERKDEQWEKGVGCGAQNAYDDLKKCSFSDTSIIKFLGTNVKKQNKTN